MNDFCNILVYPTGPNTDGRHRHPNSNTANSANKINKQEYLVLLLSLAGYPSFSPFLLLLDCFIFSLSLSIPRPSLSLIF